MAYKSAGHDVEDIACVQEGVGDFVEKPPWLVGWGGGASIENPHVQRVHYCELLVPHLPVSSALTPRTVALPPSATDVLPDGCAPAAPVQ